MAGPIGAKKQTVEKVEPPKGARSVEQAPFAPFVANSAKKGLVAGTAGLVGLAADAGEATSRYLYNVVTNPNSSTNRLLGTGSEPITDPDPFDKTRAATDFGNELLDVDPGMESPNRTVRTAGAIAEFAAGGVVPGAFVVGKAVNKIPALTAEVASSIGGGIGQEEFGPWGGIIGGLGGAAIGPSIVKAGAKGLQKLPVAQRFFNETVGADAARLNAGRDITNSLSAAPDSGLNLRTAEETAAGIRSLGGKAFNPTLGQRSGAEGVISMEQGIAGSTPEARGRHEAATDAARAAVGAAESKAFPASGRVAPLASKKVFHAEAALDKRLEVIADAERRIGDQFPDIAQQKIGEALNSARVEAMTIARGVKNQKYKDVYKAADEAKISADMSDVAELSTSLRGQNVFQRFPSVFGRIDARYAGKAAGETKYKTAGFDKPLEEAAPEAVKPASFEELHSLSRETNAQLSTAMRTGDAEGAYYLTRVKELTDAKLAKFSGPEFGNVAELKKAADDFYANKYARVFREGAGGRLAATNRFGDMIDDEKTVQRFFSPTGLDDFNEIFAGVPAAQEVLNSGVLGLFAKSALRDGIVDPKAAGAWIRRHKEALDKMPDVKAKLENAKAAQEAIISSRATVAMRQKAIDKTYMSKLIKSDDPDGMIQKALSDPGAIRGLTAMATDPKSRAVLARSVMKALPEAAAKAGVDPLTFLNNGSESLRPLLQRLGPDHEKNLKTIASAQAILGRSPTPALVRVPAASDAFKDRVGSSIPELLNSWRAVNRRQSSAFAATASAGGKFVNKNIQAAQQQLIENALYDPVLAADLGRAIRAEVLTPGLTNKISNHLVSLGVRVGAATTEDATDE